MKAKRLNWAKQWRDKDVDFWRSKEQVCFSDESTFEILLSNAQFVRRRRGKKFHSDCVVQTVKHPTKIMIWPVISGKGTGHSSRYDAARPVQRCLAKSLDSAAGRMENHTFLFKMELPAIQLGLLNLFWQNKISLYCSQNPDLVILPEEAPQRGKEETFILSPFSKGKEETKALLLFCVIGKNRDGSEGETFLMTPNLVSSTHYLLGVGNYPSEEK
ncbi:uncharacterized protein TNCV_3370541 [Trichonephila clavipes]|nr:uncharacterized protein TNCV_3370541 [Trichonephila clavipes]